MHIEYKKVKDPNNFLSTRVYFTDFDHPVTRISIRLRSSGRIR